MIKKNTIEVINHVKSLEIESGQEVKLIGASKHKNIEDIKESIAGGLTVFGENKAQELRDKAKDLTGVEWHFFGRIQKNKVNYIVKNASLIHSVSSLDILEAINKEAYKQDKIQDILLQVNMANDENKAGFNVEKIYDIFEKNIFAFYNNIRVLGIMMLPSYLEEKSELIPVFKNTKELFEDLKKYEINTVQMKYLSMGMSHDYDVAIKHGSNMVRVGSKIFGEKYI